MVDFEAFLEDLDALMNTYRNARIAFITLSQRKAGDPTPTVTTWQHAIERITKAQAAIRDLITNYAAEASPKQAHWSSPGEPLGTKSGRTEHAESNVVST